MYLPLHRTQTLTVTEQTLTFGFRAASADDVRPKHRAWPRSPTWT